ncbi:hypothetical protein [Anaerococcus sp. Marseille-P3625]|uniref:hypothetical protein n=1 Tax=Anaerococcus sp. Marseille-P3625 TaxID=1977277 RepID=UPI000C0827BB|nr:hypothetical protein [Anaerococcus sp. Marseille-P3625]
MEKLEIAKDIEYLELALSHYEKKYKRKYNLSFEYQIDIRDDKGNFLGGLRNNNDFKQSKRMSDFKLD